MRGTILRLMILLGFGLLSPFAGLGQAAEPAKALTLKEALRLAWKANPSLQVSRLEELIADQDVVRARSGFLPQVRSELNHTFYDEPTRIKVITPGAPAGLSFPLTDKNYWTSRVVVDQTVFDFWATPSRYQAAVLGKGATRLDTAQVRDNLFLLVSQGYFRVLRAEKMVTVAAQEVAQLQDHRKNAQNFFEFGVATYNDVLQAQVALADAEQRLIIADNDVTNLKSALNKLMGQPVAGPLSLAEEKDLALPALALEQASDAALKQRSDLKAAEDRIRQGEKGVTLAQSGYYPRFFAQGGHFFQENEFWVKNTQWFAILGLQWNMFSGLDTRAQVRQAKERVEQLRLKRLDLADQVRLDVQTAYLGVKETAERIRVTEKAVAQGEENLRLNRERYKEQVGTATDVIDAQTLLTKARVNFFNARYDHQMAKAQMLWAVGAINDLMEEKKP